MDQHVFSDAPSNAILPHDLLLISGADDLSTEAVLPPWVQSAMAQASVVVLRRALQIGDMIPVGVRGQSRAERFAATVPISSIRGRVTPEALVAQRRWFGNPRTNTVPAMQALARIAKLWSSLEYSWGPTGSVGFELATGVPSATVESDLDLLVRAPLRLPRADAEFLLKTLLLNGQDVPIQNVAIDIQIETPLGSVALREYVSPSSTRILMKTCTGPKLVLDPWNPQEGEF